jgi:uncharacterized protein YbjT (DUF2867 family)
MDARPILVTGAGGTVGGELVRLLAEAGADVRAGLHTMNPEVTLPAGVTPVPIDFEDPETLHAACRGAGAVYLLTPQVTSTARYVRVLVDAARLEGVEGVVRHSMHDAPHGRDALSRWHREAELIVTSSGLAHTILRPNAFMQNFVTVYAATIREQGFFRLPLGQARLSPVDARDVAAVASVVLLTEGHHGVAYTVTGPESLTGEEMAATLTSVIGGLVRYVDGPEDAVQPPRDPEGVAVSAALVGLGGEMRAGNLAAVSADTERLLGRQPRSFARFARDHRAAWA